VEADRDEIMYLRLWSFRNPVRRRLIKISFYLFLGVIEKRWPRPRFRKALTFVNTLSQHPERRRKDRKISQIKSTCPDIVYDSPRHFLGLAFNLEENMCYWIIGTESMMEKSTTSVAFLRGLL
jgi:hypothetical protein